MSSTVVHVAAFVFAILSFVVAVFHIALALGAPWGHLAMGGKFPGVLPARMRVVVTCVIPLYLFFAYVIANRAGLPVGTRHSFVWVSWAIVAVMALGTILNSISPSAPERRLWTPVAFLLFVSSTLVAVSAH